MNDPFILTSQATKVFYVPDTLLKGNWQVVQIFQHRHLWTVTESEAGHGVAGLSYQDYDSREAYVQDRECTVRTRLRWDHERVLVDVVVVEKMKKRRKEVVAEEIDDDVENSTDETMYQYCSGDDENRTTFPPVFDDDE
jgi:hypothetical protein